MLATFFLMLVILAMYQISHKHPESVANISNLSPTHLVSNICHQHRCNQFKLQIFLFCFADDYENVSCQICSYSNVVKNSPDFWLKRFKPDLMGPLKTLKKIYSLRFIALITLDDKSSSTCVIPRSISYFPKQLPFSDNNSLKLSWSPESQFWVTIRPLLCHDYVIILSKGLKKF